MMQMTMKTMTTETKKIRDRASHCYCCPLYLYAFAAPAEKFLPKSQSTTEARGEGKEGRNGEQISKVSKAIPKTLKTK